MLIRMSTYNLVTVVALCMEPMDVNVTMIVTVVTILASKCGNIMVVKVTNLALVTFQWHNSRSINSIYPL